mmetsp:Transcript_42331/g.43113  ORF Transcript_42331/g.43113 Transcript_42331/m.43113 type:complete len:418 (-) Transcript_42331:2054-3307(-)
MEQPTPTRNDDNDDHHHHHFGSLLSPREVLSKRLYCPQPKLDLLLSENHDTFNIESTLSFLPWRIQYVTLAAGDDSLSVKGDGENSTSIKQLLPSISYLDLRRQQNVEFANDKCQEANVSLKSIDVAIDLKKAKTSFIQALELVPDHLPSLIGYAKLLMKAETFYKAERIIKSALEVDPNNLEVQHYLTTLQEKRRRPQLLQSEHQESKRLVFAQKQKDLVTNKSSAYQDALIERALVDPQNGKDDEDDDNECESRHRSPNRSKKKKKDKKHRHKRKHSHRKRKSKEKKHRKLRNHRYGAYSSSSSYSCSSSLLSSSSSEIPIDSENEEELKAKKDSVHENSPSKESNLLNLTFRPSSIKRPLSKSVDSEKDEDDESYRRHKKRRKHRYTNDTKRRHKRKKHSKKSHKKSSRKRSEY